ncbi:DUF5305 family protein [Haloprofundus salilacus]|uniref:DUF5305 family protein n=1 Tax=Haloprofundus salilacus TaxID=2876190 RepID=UPI001CD025B2|nr:DUF5305 family protein [Haloprofundus salilacus]
MASRAFSPPRRFGYADITAAERRRLAYLDERLEFEEWISTVRLPSSAREKPRAEASSLGDLVDIAIDTQNAVLADPDEEAYYVVGDEYLYA